MATLQLVLAPDPVFRQKAEQVTEFNEELRIQTEQMLEVLYREKAIGLGANMVGLLKRIIVIDLQEDGNRAPLVCINPQLLACSDDTTVREESSLCFPGIRAEIKRPSSIEVSYQDVEGQPHSMKADGWMATVIQHEMEYLDGRTFLDNLSRLKRDRLVRKMLKDQKQPGTCSDPSCCPPR